MSVPLRLASFLLAAVLVAGAGHALGTAVGPLDAPAPADGTHATHGGGP